MRAKHALRFFVALIALSPITFLFQNCGKSFVAGNDGLSSLSSVAPTITISQRPADLINVRNVTVQFSAKATAISTLTKISCALDGGTPADCTSQYDMVALQDGDHALSIIAEDSRGNISEEFFVRFKVDATLPVVVVNSGPPAVAGVATAAIVFTATDNLSGVAALECSFDAAAFAACVSPQNFAALAQANHSLKIRARDGAGNQSAEVTHAWRVDLTAPVIVIATGPNNISNSRAATFTFSGTDDGVAITDFQCSLDNGAFAACTSPKAYAAIADGNHSFALRAADAAGNLSAAVTRAWMVDATAPTITLVATPTDPTAQTAATFQFTAADGAGSGIARTECSLDNGAFAACTSPQVYAGLVASRHAFRARAIDNAGNISAVVLREWTVDNLPPTLAFTATPTNLSSVTSATFAFTAADAGAGVARTECSLDNSAFAACVSPQNYAGLASTAHNFRVRAVDNVGNLSAIASFNWTIDNVVPTVAFTSTPTNPTSATTATITFTATDVGSGVARTDCSLDNAAFAACTSPSVLSNLAIGNHTFAVRATDAAGNATTAQAAWVITVPAPPPPVPFAASVVSAGAFHSCAIVGDALRCWGKNEFGQIGDGTLTTRLTPVTVIASGVTAVSAGGRHTCAIVSGALRCWGKNNVGQIGDNTLITRFAPVTVIASGVTAVSSGYTHTCAIVNGSVQCWGAYDDGLISIGPVLGNTSKIPTTVIASGATAVSGNFNHTCAIVNGSLQCWGVNTQRQLGVGTNPSLTPITVIASGVTAITAGYLRTCAIVNSALQCWGYNSIGQLGNGTIGQGLTAFQPTPLTVIASGVTAVSAGDLHTCAVVNGSLRCWGINDYGQLGNGTTTNATTPFTVIANGATSVSGGGYDHTCAIVNATVHCWGKNDVGQLGNGTTTTKLVALP